MTRSSLIAWQYHTIKIAIDMREDLLREQLAYYRARAQEYDASLQLDQGAGEPGDRPEAHERSLAVRALQSLKPCSQALELAGGTGIWTKELLSIATRITVLDGSPEMLAINKAKLADRRVSYECIDLFAWEPGPTYDLVFFAFWLSHVPPERLDAFLGKVSRAVRPGGLVFIFDEPAGGRQLSGPSPADMVQQRTLEDGRTFNIVKAYYDPLMIQARLQKLGFVSGALVVGDYFFHLVSQRQG